MNKDEANMSADLRRISYWFYNDQRQLAKNMLSKLKTMYTDINPTVGCYENIWDEVEKIKKTKDKNESSERALTLSVILQSNH